MSNDQLLALIQLIQAQVNALQNKRITQQDILPSVIKPQMLASTTAKTNGDLYYSDGTNFKRLASTVSGKALVSTTGGVPAWGTGGGATGPSGPTGATGSRGATGATGPSSNSVLSAGNSWSGSFSTTATSYVDSSTTGASASANPTATSNILIIATIGWQNDGGTDNVTLGIGKGTNTALFTKVDEPVAQSRGQVTTVSYMDLAVTAGTYVYHAGGNSSAGQALNILSGSIQVVVMPT